MHHTHRAAGGVGHGVLHTAGTSTNVEGIACGAVDMAGCPVVADGADVGGGTTDTHTSGRQEDSTSSFHNGPVGSVINVGGVAGVGVDEVLAGGQLPIVGEDDIAGGAHHGSHTSQLSSVGTLGQQVSPLAVGKGHH